jgi:NAD(P)-dependent dehydrogenase (short-subunit alcohol dehydrogenase family)
VKTLLSKGHKTVLTSRRESDGTKAVEAILETNPEYKDILFYHQLDISDVTSIKNAGEWVKETFGQLDVLINNASVQPKVEIDIIKKLRNDNPTIPEFFKSICDFTEWPITREFFDEVANTNFYGTINLIEDFLKNEVIKKVGRIITVTSSAGNCTRIENEELYKEFCNPNITTDQVLELAERYKKDIDNGTTTQAGWISKFGPLYSMSKLLKQVYIRGLANREDITTKGIQVYACCPGWVQTDIGGSYAPRPVERGILTPLYLVELDHLANPEFQGKFFYDSAPYDYCTQTLPNFGY